MTHRSSYGNGVFIVLVLIASTAWDHRALITKTEHYLLVIWLLGVILFFSFLAYRFFISRIRRLGNRSPSLYQVDNMTGLEFEKYVAIAPAKQNLLKMSTEIGVRRQSC